MSLNRFSLGLYVHDPLGKKTLEWCICYEFFKEGRLLKDKLDSDHISSDCEEYENIF